MNMDKNPSCYNYSRKGMTVKNFEIQNYFYSLDLKLKQIFIFHTELVKLY